MTDVELAIRFFLQLAVILTACRFVAWIGRRLGQTQVVSEMVAGVLLGPSLVGFFWPQFQAWLFPKAMTVQVGTESAVITHPSMSILYVVSQLGLVLYMFLVGLEFDLGFLKHRGRSAALVSFSGIGAPILLGGALGIYLHQEGNAFGPGVGMWSAAFFLGAAMSITAFPMLARIIYENGISRTSMGALALGAAAFDDAFAWCLLAVVLTSVKGDSLYAINAIGGGAAFTILAVTIGARLMRRLEGWRQKTDHLTSNMMVAVMAILMLGAWITDTLGIYAVFGAFIVGSAMPKGQLAADLRSSMEKLVTNLMLPLFFVYSGLNTKISLVDTWQLALVTLTMIVVAILAKGLACAFAARAAGESWPDAAKIGTLMNARGLIELIILNIGLQHGVITQTLFTMMVVMAIVTTLMASPIFQWLQRRYPAGETIDAVVA